MGGLNLAQSILQPYGAGRSCQSGAGGRAGSEAAGRAAPGRAAELQGESCSPQSHGRESCQSGRVKQQERKRIPELWAKCCRVPTALMVLFLCVISCAVRAHLCQFHLFLQDSALGLQHLSAFRTGACAVLLPESPRSGPEDVVGDVGLVNAGLRLYFVSPVQIFSVPRVCGVGSWVVCPRVAASPAAAAAGTSAGLELPLTRSRHRLLCCCPSHPQPCSGFVPTSLWWASNSRQRQLVPIRICSGIFVFLALIWMTNPQ